MHRIIEVSNDAYYYLLTGEKPIDEANLEEAESLDRDLSLNGSEITNYAISLLEFLPEGRVKIAITFADFTHYLEMGKYVTFEFGYVKGKPQVFYRWRQLKSSLCWGLGIADIEYNSAGKPQIKTHKGSVIPLQSPQIRKAVL